MSITSLMALLHFLSKDNQNECNMISGHVMPLAPASASCYSDVCMHVCMFYECIHVGQYKGRQT